MENEESEEKTITDDSMISVVLGESFSHWRHIENLRQGFTAVWAVVVAGVLAFITQTKNILGNTASLPALIFLVILTFLGLLMSIRLSNNIAPCEQNIRKILTNANLGEYDPTKGWEKGITKHFRLRRVFVLTYFIALVFLLTLIILTLIAT